MCLSFVLLFGLGVGSTASANIVLSNLIANLVCYYDFEHPVATNSSKETGFGFSGTELDLVNGGAAMRTDDSAYPGSMKLMQTQQLSPPRPATTTGRRGSIYKTNGVASLSAFGSATGISLMGWVKPTGTDPNPDTTTATTNDWHALLPQNTRMHIAATFDFDNGTMTLYRKIAPTASNAS